MRRATSILSVITCLVITVSASTAQTIDTAWVRFYNGPAGLADQSTALAVDAQGNTYVTGITDVSSPYSWPEYNIATVRYSPAGDLMWARRYNGPGNGDDVACAVGLDRAGDVCVAGYGPGSGTQDDYVLIKYLWKGNFLWERRYDGPTHGVDHAQSMTIDGSDHIYITGFSEGAGSGLDYATLKYNLSGALLWQQRYNGSGNGDDSAVAVAVDGAGNVYVAGTSTGTSSGLDFLTLKYGANGGLLWERRYDGEGHQGDQATALAVDQSGTAYVTGTSWTGATSSYDYLTVAYDSDGNLLWSRSYDGPGHGPDQPTAMALDSAGGVYVTGFSWAGGARSYDYATVKYSSAGDLLWEGRYNGPGGGGEVWDEAHDISMDVEGNAYVTGYSEGGATQEDCVTIKYRPSGDVLWEQRFDHGSSEHGTAVHVDGEGGIYVTGFYSYPSPDFKGMDFLTIKYVQCGCSCMADPRCDGACDIVDVVLSIDVAIRGEAGIPDPDALCHVCTQGPCFPIETTDVDCDGVTTAADITRMIDCAFGGADPAIVFCNPCAP
ncbi:MAG: hypothetical protein AB1792_09540 [Candidatus Zixiibacteriota bacterium]